MQADIFSLLRASSERARLNGTADMTIEEINAEIAEARAEMRARKQSESEIFSAFPQYDTRPCEVRA